MSNRRLYILAYDYIMELVMNIKKKKKIGIWCVYIVQYTNFHIIILFLTHSSILSIYYIHGVSYPLQILNSIFDRLGFNPTTFYPVKPFMFYIVIWKCNILPIEIAEAILCNVLFSMYVIYNIQFLIVYHTNLHLWETYLHYIVYWS